jgi:hypothetical protein
MKDAEMSQSATPATQNKVPRRLEPPKVIAFAELTIGTARTVANGGERLRNV